MKRAELLRDVKDRLGNRRLIWAGLRGDDIEAITDLSNLAESFSIIGAYAQRSSIESMAFEDLTGTRVDLEAWDIDDHLQTQAAATFRRALLRALSRPSALLAYRPSRFLSAICFARRDRCVNLGLFGGFQAAFEHKPWVESSLASVGIPHIPWTYVADEEQLRTREFLDRGPVMLRRSRTSGGYGIVRVDDPVDLIAEWPHEEEAFVSVAPFFSEVLPVNIGATVWDDGVTLHHPSIQLIGVPSCVSRPFGYCGNDFALASSLDTGTIDQIESSTIAIGRWLHRYGYRGTFGVDYLVSDDQVLFTEVNPRFQGSTHASCQLSLEADEGCLILEHIGALLGLAAPPRVPLRDIVRRVTPLSHFVLHWMGEKPSRLDPAGLRRMLRQVDSAVRIDVLTKPSLVTEVDAVIARVTTRNTITTSGFDFLAPWSSTVDAWLASDHGHHAVPNTFESQEDLSC